MTIFTIYLSIGYLWLTLDELRVIQFNIIKYTLHAVKYSESILYILNTKGWFLC